MLTPAELRDFAKDADDTINYAFSEPMVAISAVDALALADRVEIAEQLYRALKRMPCSCAYKRNPEGKWMWAIPEGGGPLSRILERKCAKCEACERYEREMGV